MADTTTEPDESPLIPAATVVLIRDAKAVSGSATDDTATNDAGIEVLMLRRNAKIAFASMWVFPGGRVDDDELDPDDELASALRAAVRECDEETGLRIEAADLETWSHWTPPIAASMVTAGPRRRFSTWFFVAVAPTGAVVIDDGEIEDHQWMSPADALARRDAGEMELVPPTWVTLHQLGHYRSAADVVAHARATEPEHFVTTPLPGDPIGLAWHGDAAVPSGDRDLPGGRHRLLLDPDGWVYERSSEEAESPSPATMG